MTKVEAASVFKHSKSHGASRKKTTKNVTAQILTKESAKAGKTASDQLNLSDGLRDKISDFLSKRSPANIHGNNNDVDIDIDINIRGGRGHGKIDALNETISNLNTSVENLGGSVADLTESNEALTEQLSSATTTIKTLSTRLRDISVQLDDLRSDLSTFSTKLESVSTLGSDSARPEAASFSPADSSATKSGITKYESILQADNIISGFLSQLSLGTLSSTSIFNNESYGAQSSGSFGSNTGLTDSNSTAFKPNPDFSGALNSLTEVNNTTQNTVFGSFL